MSAPHAERRAPRGWDKDKYEQRAKDREEYGDEYVDGKGAEAEIRDRQEFRAAEAGAAGPRRTEKRAAAAAAVERHKTLDVGEEYERRLQQRDEDDAAEKAARREAKRQRKEERAAADQAEDPDFDAEMNAMMGFGGFGGSKATIGCG
ncbi:mRNA splicing protein [Aureococcus anophagefferens]|uniref:mRNA splicing protein n=1 Tax=Aureococcus anophagefferens TaxID=44056 RepID=A0ABR1FLG1_AURAN